MRYLAPLFALLLLVAPLASGATPEIAISVEVNPTHVAPGDVFNAEVTFDCIEGWHIYGLNAGPGPTSTSIALTGPEGFETAGPATGPDPIIHFDQGFQRDIPIHEGSTTITLPIRASEELTAGEHEISLQVRYQLCTNTTCLRPMRDTLTATVTIDPTAEASNISIASATPPASGSAAIASDRLEDRRTEIFTQGLARFLLTAIVAGFASLLTPCVFPMIPITVSLFTKRSERGEGNAVVSAGIYALTIIATFTILGMVLAITWGASGARGIAADPWVNLFIGALFVALALSLFGMFELRMPGWLLNAVGKGQQRSGAAGIIFMGIAFTLTSFTCTVAFVGLLLAQAAQGDWLWPGLGMLVFSTCFALPFFLLALFPHWLSKLPRAGGWMNITKVLMGFLELAAAFKFLSNSDLVWDWGFLRNQAVLISWSVIALFMTLYLLGVFRLGHDTPTPALSVGRMLMSMGTAVLTVILLVGVFGGPLPVIVATYLPEISVRTHTSSTNETPELQWYEDLDEGLAVARETGKPVFVDFTGYTCTNCRQMEIQIFPQPEVRRLLEQFVRVRLYTDDREVGDKWAAVQDERFGNSALPFYALLTPDDEVIDTRAGMVRPAEAFAAFLSGALQ